MRVVNCPVRTVLWFVAASSLGACTAPNEPATGSLTIQLSGATPDGTVYRLRDATITVTGPESVDVFHTEDNPDLASLSATVSVGAYTALLDPGWRLERLDSFSETDVNAELVSDNPLHFTVEFDQRTTVPLRFRTNLGEIDLSQGYDLVLEVDEIAVQGVVVSNFTALQSEPGLAVFAPDASGTEAPLRTIGGFTSTLLTATSIAMAGHEIIVADQTQFAIDVFPRDGSGDIAPTRQLAGDSTELENPSGVAVYNGELYVANLFDEILVFPLAASGDVAPTRRITGLGETRQIAIDRETGELFAPDAQAGVIRVFPASASGPVVPTRILGGPTTGLKQPSGVALMFGKLLVADASNGHISTFFESADGNAAPLRVISSPATAPGFVKDLAVSRDEIYVANQVTDSVNVFPINASGDVAPTRSFAQIGVPFHPFVPFGIAVF